MTTIETLKACREWLDPYWLTTAEGQKVLADLDALIAQGDDLPDEPPIATPFWCAVSIYGRCQVVKYADYDALRSHTQALASRLDSREAVLEEAARICEEHGQIVSNEDIGKATSKNCAIAIRSLKAPPVAKEPT